MDSKINKHLENRPWGEEEWFGCAPSMVKIITVNPGEILSLQTHQNREEFWHVISGHGSAQVGEEIKPIVPGDEIFVPRETKHRISGGGDTLVFLELAFGVFDESDIIRLEDKYGRVKE